MLDAGKFLSVRQQMVARSLTFIPPSELLGISDRLSIHLMADIAGTEPVMNLEAEGAKGLGINQYSRREEVRFNDVTAPPEETSNTLTDLAADGSPRLRE